MSYVRFLMAISRCLTHCVLVVFSILLSAQLKGQDEIISDAIFERYEKIVVRQEGGYSSEVHLEGVALSKGTWGVVYSELEGVSKAEFNGIGGGKVKTIKQNKMVSNDLSGGAFYTGTKAHMFPVEEGQFELSYQKKHSELAFLSCLDFGRSQTILSSNFVIEMPLTYSLVIDSSAFLVDQDLVQIVVLETEDVRSYSFNCVIGIDSISEEMSEVDWLLRILTVPTNEINFPEQYFANWYRGLAAPNKHITTKGLNEITLGKQVEDFSDSLSFVDYVFDQVKTNVSYIDIENNIGAVQPRLPDVICERKQGDCKDMANLLCSILRTFDFQTYLGISATKSHVFKNNFPSLSSGNHLVCMLWFQNEWIQLDATDRFAPFQWPSCILREPQFLLSLKTASSTLIFHLFQLTKVI
ncbi:MAG: hypothetical protein ACI898_001982 [Flavobacteriales bacterium]|jgi:hypothetical protein